MKIDLLAAAGIAAIAGTIVIGLLTPLHGQPRSQAGVAAPGAFEVASVKQNTIKGQGRLRDSPTGIVYGSAPGRCDRTWRVLRFQSQTRRNRNGHRAGEAGPARLVYVFALYRHPETTRSATGFGQSACGLPGRRPRGTALRQLGRSS